MHHQPQPPKRAFPPRLGPSMLATALLMAATGLPAEPISYQQASLSAEARRDIDNDLMTATLFVEQSDQEPAKLADLINRRINDALQLGKNFNSVKLRTSGRNTYPLYNQKNQAEGWRSRAELELESRDFAAASELIGQLQATLQLSGVGFSVAADTRDKVQDELIAEAIAGFRRRADIIAQGFGLHSWKTVQVNIGANDRHPPMPMYKTARAAASFGAGQEEVAAPDLSAGSSQISVTVTGTVEMLP